MFDQTGKFLASFGTPGKENGQLSYPSGLVIDFDGNAIIVDCDNRRVQIFDSSYQWKRSFGGEGAEDGRFLEPYAVGTSNQACTVPSVLSPM